MPALAQEQPKTATAEQAADKKAEEAKVKELDRMVVTGSLLRRPEYESTSPIQTIDIQQNLAAGQFDTADFLQSSAVAASTTQFNNQFAGFVIEGGTGVQTLDLRGLGASRSLVLLDGQRPGPAGTRGQVGAFDLNVIPQSILQRIEIVKDGSSSIYGSDAVAGVVNMITRKRLDNTLFNFSVSVPQQGGGEQFSASIANGWNFENGSFILSAQVDRLNALTYGQRDFLRCAEDLVWGTDGQRIDREDRSILAGTDLAGCNNLYANTIIDYFSSSTRYVPTWDGTTIGPFPGYRPRPIPTPTYANSPQAYYRDVLNFPFFGSSQAINERDRASVYLKTDFSIGEVNWSTQWLVNRRETNTHNYRQFFPVVYNPGNGRYYQPVMPFPSDQKVTVDYFYFANKLQGLMGWTDSWSWETNATYSRSSGVYSSLAIDAAKSGDLTNPNNDLASPLVDYFDPGILDGTRMNDLVAAVGAISTGKTIYDQTTVNALASGNLFALPAGDVQGAFGLEYRRYSINDQPSELARTGRLWGSSSAQVTKGSDRVKEVFAEVQVPILKDLPLAESVLVNLSGRAFRYDTVPGTNQVWKVGLNWALTPELRLRGSIGTSFRAPGLYELYLGNQTGFLSQLSIDPCILWGDSTNDFIRANCAAAGIPATYDASGTSSATIYSGGGKGFLRPETSRAKTAGIVWTPGFAKLSVALDYFDYDIKDEITQLGAGDILFGCYGSPVYPNNFCNQIVRNAPNAPAQANMITAVYSVYVNINKQRQRGFDLQMNYETELPFGVLSTDAQVTYTLEDIYQLFDTAAAGGFTAEDQIGYIGRPKTVALANASLRRGKWTYAWQGTYVSSTKNKDLSPTYTYLGYAGARRDITAAWQIRHNVSVRYDNDDWYLMFGIRNLFDKAPDTVSTGVTSRYGNTPILASQYDWYGRTYFVRYGVTF